MILILITVLASFFTQATELQDFLPETLIQVDKSTLSKKLEKRKGKVFYKKKKEHSLPPKVEIIFDSSGSMGQMLSDNKSKMYISKDILKKYLTKQWKEKALVGLRIYGAKRKSDCKDTELTIGFKEKSLYSIERKIKKLSPLGMTPLHSSIKYAVEDLKDYPGPKRIVILTDGEDTCGGDPCKTVEFLKNYPELDLKFYTVGIGFADGNYNIRAMKCLGSVLNAKNEGDFQEGLDRIDEDIFSKFKNLQIISPKNNTKVKIYQQINGEKKLVRTFSSSEKITLDPGEYSAELDLNPSFIFEKFKIKKNRLTILKVKGFGKIFVDYYDKLLNVEVIDVHGKVIKEGRSLEEIEMPMGSYEVRIFHTPLYEYKVPSFYLYPNAFKKIKITDATSIIFKNKILSGFHVYKGDADLYGKFITNAKAVIRHGLYRFYLNKTCNLPKVIINSKEKFKTITCQ